MIRTLKLAIASFALVPLAAQAQNDGLGGLEAIMNDDSAETWTICTLASAYTAQDEPDPDIAALRDEELEMLVDVAGTRLMEQRGLSGPEAKEEFNRMIAERAPLYDDGSDTYVYDLGMCILAGMVSQTGTEHAERLLAAYQALPPIEPEPQPAPVPAAGTRPPAPAQPPAVAHTDFAAALGQGYYLGAASYFIGPDGVLSGHWAANGRAPVYSETATPRVRGQGLAGTYDTRGSSSDGAYEGTITITELYQIEDGLTLYRLVWNSGATGTGMSVGGVQLNAVMSGTAVGQFFRRDDGQGWDLYLVTDAAGEPAFSQFQLQGGHLDGSHAVLVGEDVRRPAGTATVTSDAAGVVRIAMPGGQEVIAVCNRVSAAGC